jgi:hypothetical protein
MQYADWYEQDREFLRSLFGDGWRLMAGLLAATSPRVRLEVSWRWSTEIYRIFTAGREPDLSMLQKCHILNVKRALAGEPLQGRKVKAFYVALCGDMNAVVLDTWMLRLFKYYPRHTHSPQGGRYDRLAAAFRCVARHNGIEPAELQAMLWINYRQKNGYEPVSYRMAGQDKNQYTFEDLM